MLEIYRKIYYTEKVFIMGKIVFYVSEVIMLNNFNPVNLLIKALVLFTALPVHECAHAWVASKLGDNTARYQGRITLNPAKHLDLFGSLAMLLVGFGWAKPVPINPRNFKNRKAGMAISSLAGPVSNLLLAYIALILEKVIFYLGVSSNFSTLTIRTILEYVVILNIGLAIFNLLPIPPLDGSRIATLFLPTRTYFKIMQYEQYIYIGLILVIFSGIFDKPLAFLQLGMFNILDFLTGYIDIIFRAVIK